MDAIKHEEEKKYAILIESNVPYDKMIAAFQEAQELRNQGKTVTVQALRKNAKFQINKLIESGYTEIQKVYNDD